MVMFIVAPRKIEPKSFIQGMDQSTNCLELIPQSPFHFTWTSHLSSPQSLELDMDVLEVPQQQIFITSVDPISHHHVTPKLGKVLRGRPVSF